MLRVFSLRSVLYQAPITHQATRRVHTKVSVRSVWRTVPHSEHVRLVYIPLQSAPDAYAACSATNCALS